MLWLTLMAIWATFDCLGKIPWHEGRKPATGETSSPPATLSAGNWCV